MKKEINYAFIGAISVVIIYLLFLGFRQWFSFSDRVSTAEYKIQKLENSIYDYDLYRCGSQIRSWISLDEFENGKCEFIKAKIY